MGFSLTFRKYNRITNLEKACHYIVNLKTLVYLNICHRPLFNEKQLTFMCQSESQYMIMCYIIYNRVSIKWIVTGACYYANGQYNERET